MNRRFTGFGSKLWGRGGDPSKCVLFLRAHPDNWCPFGGAAREASLTRTFCLHLLLFLWSFARPLQLDVTRRCAVMRGGETEVDEAPPPSDPQKAHDDRPSPCRQAIAFGESSNVWARYNWRPSPDAPPTTAHLSRNNGIRRSSARHSFRHPANEWSLTRGSQRAPTSDRVDTRRQRVGVKEVSLDDEADSMKQPRFRRYFTGTTRGVPIRSVAPRRIRC